MARANSTAASSTRKWPPRKPKNHPCSPHASGYWRKRVNGVLYYFGPRWGSAAEALEDYENRIKAIREDRDGLVSAVKPDGAAVTIATLCNHFIADRKHRFEAGELKQGSYDDYFKTCERIVKAFGRKRLVSELAKEDFQSLRKKMGKRWKSPHTIANEVQRIRTVFKFGFDESLLDNPVRFGTSFRKPSKKMLRVARQEKGPRMFEAEQIKTLLDKTSVQLKAMILLGVNCGFGNNDCAQLPISAINLDEGWIDFPRPKTAIERRCYLWQETLSALREAYADRTQPKLHKDRSLFFVTTFGNPYVKPKDDAIAKEMRKLLDETGLYRKGLGFYALRHTFETIGGESRDQVAVDAVMGHVRDDMASLYRERISDERLQAVAEHVREWLFGPQVA